VEQLSFPAAGQYAVEVIECQIDDLLSPESQELARSANDQGQVLSILLPVIRRAQTLPENPLDLTPQEGSVVQIGNLAVKPEAD